MKLILLILLSISIFLPSEAQKGTSYKPCNCDSLINSYRLGWSKWVKNSDSIFIVKVKYKFTINSEKDKQAAIQKILNARWTAIIGTSNESKVTIKLGKTDTLYGKHFYEFNPDGSEKSSISYATKDEVKKNLQEQVSLGDKYYDVYFQVGDKTIISPSICINRYWIIDDNIFENLWMQISKQKK